MKTDDLISEVTSLPVEERVLIADRILRSLNPPDSDADQKWAVVAKRRLEQLRSGQVQARPSDDVFAKIWDRFGV